MQDLTLVLVGFFSILVFISLILLVIYILAYWFILSKAGEPRWKALIPFYSTYTVFKLTWNTKMFALYMGLAVITNILVWMGGTAAVASYLFSLGTMVVSILSCVKLGLSFGKGPGFIIGLVFLNPIFLLILAFDGSRYLGPEGKRAAAGGGIDSME